MSKRASMPLGSRFRDSLSWRRSAPWRRSATSTVEPSGASQLRSAVRFSTCSSTDRSIESAVEAGKVEAELDDAIGAHGIEGTGWSPRPADRVARSSSRHGASRVVIMCILLRRCGRK